MRYWDNAGPESPTQGSATINSDDGRTGTVSDWQIKKSWVAGGVFCIVIMVDMVFAWLLEWGWPKADIDVVLPVASEEAFESESQEEEEEANAWNGDDGDDRGSMIGNA